MATSSNPPNPPIRLLAAFQERFPEQPLTWLVNAPGWEMWAAAAACDGHDLTLAVPDMEGQTTFSLRSAKGKRTVANRPLPRWARYPAGTLVALGDMGFEISGLNIAMVGEEPPGPRYDYALGVVFAALAYEIHGYDYTRANLIEVVERVRRDYMGE
ncbi:MAG: hypothetical protein H6672_03110 [Anaerolineaceae bacterium]|nr:hypothetical protein [Anaerolineaceae bacterium]